MRFFLIIVLFFGFVSCDKVVDSNRERETNDIERIITEFESELRADLSEDGIDGSISAVVVRGNRVIWSKAFGYADRENRVPADTTTIYRAASVSKSFTAFLMMKLAEDGTIKLTDPVELYLPEIRELMGYSRFDEDNSLATSQPYIRAM